MLTARDRLEDRIKGLDSGADLYFAKPVDLRELASAIGSLDRRLGVTAPSPWRLEPAHSALHTPGGVVVALTDLELRFLSPLLARPGDVVDREDLCQAKVLRAAPEDPLPVKARHGRGYAFLG
jgi:DNA-binding response OmpR family regulator